MRWWRGWAPLVVLPGAVLAYAPARWPPWIVMWALAVAIYSGCKWLTWRRTPVAGVPAWRHAAYVLAWPGLDAGSFLTRPAERVPTRADWLGGLRNVAVGLVLFFGLARVIAPTSVYLAGWTGMIASVLVLHFGLFQLLSCGWRLVGIDARPLMNRPIASVSLSEFWGRRWNTAFRDLTHRFLFRPMMRRVGARGGIAAGFLFSGLVHDLVISVPAGGGYGGPDALLHPARRGHARRAHRRRHDHGSRAGRARMDVHDAHAGWRAASAPMSPSSGAFASCSKGSSTRKNTSRPGG